MYRGETGQGHKCAGLGRFGGKGLLRGVGAGGRGHMRDAKGAQAHMGDPQRQMCLPRGAECWHRDW